MEPAIASLFALSAAASIVGGGFVVGRRIVHGFNHQPAQLDRALYQLIFPAELAPAQVQSWLTSVTGAFYGDSSPIAFEVVATQGSIRHYVRLFRSQEHYVISQLRGLVPDMHVQPVERLPHSQWSIVQELGESDPTRLLRIPDVEMTATTMLGALRQLDDREAVCFQWVVTPATPKDVPREAPQPWKTNSVLVDAMLKKYGTSKLAHAEAFAKSQEPNVKAVLRVGIFSPTAGRSGHLLHDVGRALASVQGNGNRLVPVKPQLLSREPGSTENRFQHAAGMGTWPAQLTLNELSALISWPLGAHQVPGIQRATTRHMWPDNNMPTHGVVLGMSTVPGSNRPITLPIEDFMRHVHLPGKIGTGKSTVLENIAAQIMQDKRKPGLILIDPHGDLAEHVIDLVPEDRINDVVYLNPMDIESPVGLNLMNGDTPASVTSYLMGVLTKLFGAGPATSELLRNTIYTVALHPGMTLYEVALTLHDADFRAEVTRDIKDEFLRNFWRAFNAKSARDQAHDIEPVMRRLGPLLTPEFRGIFGQVGKVDIKELLDGGKILVVNLSEGMLGEGPAQLLGSLLVARIWQEVRRRSAIPEDKRHPVVMLADEFQRFMHFPNSFGDILAEARKFKFGLVLAHQLMDQIREVREDVMANTRNKVILQTVAQDASLIAREIGVQPEDIQRLGKNQAILSLVHDNHPANPATAITLPPPKPTGFGNRARYTSRARYSIPREDVEAQLAARRHRRIEHKRMRPTIGKEQ